MSTRKSCYLSLVFVKLWLYRLVFCFFHCTSCNACNVFLNPESSGFLSAVGRLERLWDNGNQSLWIFFEFFDWLSAEQQPIKEIPLSQSFSRRPTTDKKQEKLWARRNLDKFEICPQSLKVMLEMWAICQALGVKIFLGKKKKRMVLAGGKLVTTRNKKRMEAGRANPIYLPSAAMICLSLQGAIFCRVIQVRQMETYLGCILLGLFWLFLFRFRNNRIHGISVSKRTLIHPENGILMTEVTWRLMRLPTGSQVTGAHGPVGFPAKNFPKERVFCVFRVNCIPFILFILLSGAEWTEWYSVHSENGIAPKRTQIPSIASNPIPE